MYLTATEMQAILSVIKRLLVVDYDCSCCWF